MSWLVQGLARSSEFPVDHYVTQTLFQEMMSQTYVIFCVAPFLKIKTSSPQDPLRKTLAIEKYKSKKYSTK